MFFESNSFYQVEIYQKIYLINLERNRLYYYDKVEGPVLIAAASSNIKQLTLLQKYEVLNAPFQEITDVTGDLDGNLYISECKANKIYKLVPSFNGTVYSSLTTKPQYTIEIFAENKGTSLLAPQSSELSCPYGLHYLEHPENKGSTLKEGLYFINQHTCQIRLISKNTGIIEIFYTLHGLCSSKMTFLSVHPSSLTMYYLTEPQTTIHILQPLIGPENEKDFFLHESILETEYRERLNWNGEEGEDQRGLLFVKSSLLTKIHSDEVSLPPSLAPTPDLDSSNSSDLTYSSLSFLASRRRLQYFSLLLDFAFAPSDVSGSPAKVSNHGTLSSISGTLSGSPVATCVNLAWKIGYTSALTLVSTSSQYVMLDSFSIPDTGISFAFWYRCNGCASDTRVFDFSSSGSYQIIYKIDTGAIVTQSTSAFTSTITTPSSVCNQGAWCFIVWTMTYVSTSSSQTSTHVIYLNGTQYSSTGAGYYPRVLLRNQNYFGATSSGVGPYSPAGNSFPMEPPLKIGEEETISHDSHKDDSFSDESDESEESGEEENIEKQEPQKKKNLVDTNYPNKYYSNGNENVHEKEEDLIISLISGHNDRYYNSNVDVINDENSSPDLSSLNSSLREEDYEYLV
eukprot:gene12616-13809_t